MIESIARRVERRLVHEKLGSDALPLDSEDDELEKIATAANAELAPKNEQENVMAIEVMSPSERNPAMLDEVSTADLVKEMMDEAKELVRLEVALAKEEAKEELAQVQHAAISLGIAAGASVIMLCMLAVALVLALGGTALAALGVAGGFLVVAGVTAYLGYGMLPKHPLQKTRHRLENDVNQLKEHIA